MLARHSRRSGLISLGLAVKAGRLGEPRVFNDLHSIAQVR